ncbi:MAG: 16S rRNA (guanine(527)-N(7))-methyltransferase RsmG [Bacilli bacterium]|nr:16S rRNA (guanine(527)-N(7))-methyltransferase RsmG [Bacilli bacterium]
MKTKINDIINNNAFKKYFDFLIEENQKYNLTSITEEKEVYIKHFLDSLSIENIIDLDNISLCDVGSGAGFPSIPLKIMYPSIKLTIIEPTAKRCNFLQQIVEMLDLKDVNIINDRAENIKDMHFDVVCARAVSNLPILLELCIPLVKVNGYFISMKGSNYKEELDIANNAFKELDCRIDNIYEYDLDEFGKRVLIKIIKDKETKKIYPRLYSQIKKKPL